MALELLLTQDAELINEWVRKRIGAPVDGQAPVYKYRYPDFDDSPDWQQSVDPTGLEQLIISRQERMIGIEKHVSLSNVDWMPDLVEASSQVLAGVEDSIP